MKSHENANRYAIEKTVRSELKGRLSEINLAFSKDAIKGQEYVEVRGKASSLNDCLRAIQVVKRLVGEKVMVRNMMRY